MGYIYIYCNGGMSGWCFAGFKTSFNKWMDKLIPCMRNIVYVYYICIYMHKYDVIQYMSTLLTNKYVQTPAMR